MFKASFFAAFGTALGFVAAGAAAVLGLDAYEGGKAIASKALTKGDKDLLKDPEVRRFLKEHKARLAAERENARSLPATQQQVA